MDPDSKRRIICPSEKESVIAGIRPFGLIYTDVMNDGAQRNRPTIRLETIALSVYSWRCRFCASCMEDCNISSTFQTSSVQHISLIPKLFQCDGYLDTIRGLRRIEVNVRALCVRYYCHIASNLIFDVIHSVKHQRNRARL